jgi:hypothetical protein
MIGYFIDFIQNNIFMIIAILVSVILLSLAFKHFRRVMFGGLITGTVSLILAIIHKALGYGLQSFYSLFQRVFYFVTRYIELAQNQLIENKSVLSLVVTLLESDEMLKLILTNKLTLDLFIDLAKTDFKCFIQNIKIAFNKISTNIQYVYVRKINRSSLAFVYRC